MKKALLSHGCASARSTTTAGQIVGDGMLARAFASAGTDLSGVVLFASGTSRSSTTVAAEFEREAELLYETLHRARLEGRCLVYFSTASEHLYGRQQRVGEENGPIYPCTAYGRHKAAMEAVLRFSAVDHLILRLSQVVGPNQPEHQLVPALARQLARGEVTIHRGARRDLIDVADVVTITADLLAAGRTGVTINVASGFPVPIADVVDHLTRRSSVPVHRTTYRNTATDRCRICTASLRRLAPVARQLGFSPHYYREVIDHYYYGPGQRRPPQTGPQTR